MPIRNDPNTVGSVLQQMKYSSSENRYVRGDDPSLNDLNDKLAENIDRGIKNAQNFKKHSKFREDIRSKVKKPPKDYQYDDYGSNKVNRVVDYGTYQDIELKKYESPMGDPHSFSKILNNELFMISDVKIASTSTRTREIQRVINKKVGRSDNLLFLGNMLDSHTSTQWATLQYFIDGLTCKNLYLILGDTDVMFIDDYYKLGFKYITDRAEKTIDGKKVIFTHFPVPVMSKEFNIHGNNPIGGDIGLMGLHNHYSVHIGVPGGFKVHTFKDVKGSVVV